jgi:hypothetical protein
MDRAERVLSDTKDVLEQLSRLRVRCEQLLAVSVNGSKRGVWLHDGSEWERVSGVPDECDNDGVCLCRVTDGMIVCGGWTDRSLSGHCHHFSLLTRHWRKLADMITPRCYASAVEYVDGKLLVAGGVTSGGKWSAVCEELDCKRDRWSSGAGLPQAFVKPLMAAEAGQVFIMEQNHDLDQPRMLVYDPSAEKGILRRPSHKYTSAPPGVRSTEGACLAAAGQRLYLLGGEEGLALEYNPRTDQWGHLTPPSPRYGWMGDHGYYKSGCCAAVSDGMIRVYGGSSSTEGGDCNRVEVYDTRARKWQTLDMRLPFMYSQYTVLVAHYH